MVRFKRRYFCVEVNFQESDLNSITKRIKINKLKHLNLSDTIHKSIEKFYGDYGMATMMPSFSVIYFNLNTNLAIVRTARDLKEEFHNVLTFTRKLDDFDVAFKTIHVSGSIKKCKKYLLEYCKQRLKLINNHISTEFGIKKSSTDSDNEKEVVESLEKLVECCQQDDNMFNLK
jgi:ribonuclease P/MRP protein subunit POP5